MPAFLRLMAVQYFQHEYNLPNLAPESCLITTQAIKSQVRQICEAQETTSKLNRGIHNGVWAAAGHASLSALQLFSGGLHGPLTWL